MKIIVAGTRYFEDYNKVKETLDNLLEKNILTSIISGGAKGADFLGEKWAKEHNIPLEIFSAEWEKYGKKAGMLRNKEMGDEGDMLVAFWDGNSKGTYHMIEYMKKLKKPIKIIKYNEINLDEEW